MIEMQFPDYDSDLMTVINGSTPEHLDMIGSEVIQRLLADKWKAFAQLKLIERLVLFIFQLITLSIVVYIRPTELPRLYMEDPQWDDWVRTVCAILTIGNCIFFVGYQQFGEIRTQGMRGYLRNSMSTSGFSALTIIIYPFLGSIQLRFLENRFLGREKNHLYDWACVGKEAEPRKIYEKSGQKGGVKFDDLKNIQTGFPVLRRL